VAYWTTFNISCPKHDPMKSLTSFKEEQETIEVKAAVRDLKLQPSFLTYAITLHPTNQKT
jgi:hypothetical protein